jgi:hypothetical protein
MEEIAKLKNIATNCPVKVGVVEGWLDRLEDAFKSNVEDCAVENILAELCEGDPSDDVKTLGNAMATLDSEIGEEHAALATKGKEFAFNFSKAWHIFCRDKITFTRS